MTTSLSRLLLHDVPPVAGADMIFVQGLTADSREVKPGFVFAALPGVTSNGADYIPQALAAGAVAVICAKGIYNGSGLAIEAENPRQLLARMAARFHGPQPETIVAVTGTNGKTSVAVFVRQIWEQLGFRAASLGTIGVVGPGGTEYLQHTTPDPVKLHATLARLAEDHVQHLAVEASSHGLSQYRLDGLQLAAGGFTNLTRDHLDYHGSLDDYFEAKMRLFTEVLPHGAPAVINMDSSYGEELRIRCEASGLRSFTVGTRGSDIRLVATGNDGLTQVLSLATPCGKHEVSLPLAGTFQASNALVAAGLVIAVGGETEKVLHALSSLKGAPGRLDFVGNTANGAAVFVDYAHTPDALANALQALRPTTKGKLHVVFGCGGDRDKGKRPLMARAAAEAADVVYVTDDNPRSEDPAVIRRETLVGAPGAIEIGDRAEAIAVAVKALRSGDILLVAGKGHEEGQIIGSVTKNFSDHAAVRAALRGETYHG